MATYLITGASRGLGLEVVAHVEELFDRLTVVLVLETEAIEVRVVGYAAVGVARAHVGLHGLALVQCSDELAVLMRTGANELLLDLSARVLRSENDFASGVQLHAFSA